MFFQSQERSAETGMVRFYDLLAYLATKTYTAANVAGRAETVLCLLRVWPYLQLSDRSAAVVPASTCSHRDQKILPHRRFGNFALARSLGGNTNLFMTALL